MRDLPESRPQAAKSVSADAARRARGTDEDVTRPSVFTISEAARLLCIGRGSAYQAAACGQLPTIRIGRRLLVPRAALERLLEQAGIAPVTGGGGDGR